MNILETKLCQMNGMKHIVEATRDQARHVAHPADNLMDVACHQVVSQLADFQRDGGSDWRQMAQKRATIVVVFGVWLSR